MQTSLQQLINLEGKTAVVTGGAMGIGLGIARRLAEAGASIVIADINDEVGAQATEELVAAGARAVFIHADVSGDDDVRAVIALADQTYGGVDILVNNAGIYPMMPVMQMTIEDFEKIISINLKSAFLFTKYASESMIARQKGGKIINITSIDALHPSAVGLAVYDASKHGLWGFTKNTALELAPHNIQVNAIAPGGIATPGTGAGNPSNPLLKETTKAFLKKIPMKRMGDPDDIGKVALFLSSDLSSYMTGTQVVVDGGVLLS
jgi:2-deoxy-D-gluconate 3-dehydrogenase